MDCSPAEVVADMNVCVVWSEDFDPLATAPLWASVRFVTAGSSKTLERSNGLGGVVIEVSATRPSRQRNDHTCQGCGHVRPAPSGLTS
jgi:hypothetical protein